MQCLKNYLAPLLAGYINQFFANEALREGVLGVVAIVMVGDARDSHVAHRSENPTENARTTCQRYPPGVRSVAAIAGVFLFTFLMITREGMETALLLMQVRDSQLVYGAMLGVLAAAAFAWGWARFGHLINVRRFFQVTGIFLLLFMIQVAIYSFHEFAEAGLLPNSEVLHAATEKFSPDGLYGKWFSPLMITICGLWLFVSWLIDRARVTRVSGMSHLEGAR